MQKKLTSNLLLFGSSDIDADIRYASGFCAPDPIVYLELNNKRYIITSVMEAERARREALPDIIVITPQELGLCTTRKYSTIECIKTLMLKNKVKHVAIPENFPVGIMEKIRKSKIHITVLKKSPLLEKRAIKTEKEIALIRYSQEVAVLTLEYILNIIKQSKIMADDSLMYKGQVLTSEFLRTEAVKFMADYHCHSTRTIIACGKESAQPHWIGYGKLYANQPIIIDIFPQDEHSGYWGDLTRTVVKGKVPPLLKEMYNAVAAAQKQVMTSMASGVSCKYLHNIASQVLREHGFKTMLINGKMQGFIHSTGHGVGLAIHEHPTLGNIEVKLASGNIVTVEPGLYYHRIGGIRIEDTVLVTNQGYKMLAAAPSYFVL